MEPVLPPPLWVNTTAEPPLVRLLPAASFAVKLNVVLLPEVMVDEATVISEFATLITPGVTVTVGEFVVIRSPSMVAVIEVAAPTRTPVKLAV